MLSINTEIFQNRIFSYNKLTNLLSVIFSYLHMADMIDINLVIVITEHCVSDFCKRFNSGFQLNMLR